jgi:hypothetical protein
MSGADLRDQDMPRRGLCHALVTFVAAHAVIESCGRAVSHLIVSPAPCICLRMYSRAEASSEVKMMRVTLGLGSAVNDASSLICDNDMYIILDW